MTRVLALCAVTALSACASVQPRGGIQPVQLRLPMNQITASYGSSTEVFVIASPVTCRVAPCTDMSVQMSFRPSAGGVLSFGGQPLGIEVDGRQLTAPNSERVGNVQSEEESLRVSRTTILTAVLDGNAFQTVAGARNVVLTVGGLRFPVGREDRLALGRMYNQMRAAPLGS